MKGLIRVSCVVVFMVFASRHLIANAIDKAMVNAEIRSVQSNINYCVGRDEWKTADSLVVIRDSLKAIVE
jgi:hypothetical protein